MFIINLIAGAIILQGGLGSTTATIQPTIRGYETPVTVCIQNCEPQALQPTETDFQSQPAQGLQIDL